MLQTGKRKMISLQLTFNWRQSYTSSSVYSDLQDSTIRITLSLILASGQFLIFFLKSSLSRCSWKTPKDSMKAVSSTQGQRGCWESHSNNFWFNWGLTWFRLLKGSPCLISHTVSLVTNGVISTKLNLILLKTANWTSTKCLLITNL